MAHSFNPSTWEAEVGGFRDQPGLQELVPVHVSKIQRNPVSKKGLEFFKTNFQASHSSNPYVPPIILFPLN